MAFDKKKYDAEYRKNHKTKVSLDINKEEAIELDNLCKEKGLTKVQIFRLGIEKAKEIK